VASAIAALTPSTSDDEAVGKVKTILDKIIDVLALNLGNAKKP